MNIRRGDRGEKVQALQRALNANGFNLNDDGVFGAKTEEAVKSFQGRNDLKVDGIAGKDTLRALGLDADTLQPLSVGDSSSGSDVEVITFTEEEVTVPPVVKQRIREFAEMAVEGRGKLLMTTLNALAQFETTMAHASASEANADVLGVLVSDAIDRAVDTMVGQVPGLSEVRSIYDTVTGELERAGKARQSLDMGNWIKDQRAVIDRGMQDVRMEDLLFELEEGYLDHDQEGRNQFLQQLFEGSQRMQDLRLADIDEMECAFYEQWINAHFADIGDDAPGCIEFRFEYDDNTLDFNSCAVEAPSGDKIESAINRLLDRGSVPGINQPIDLKVRKRATFWVDNLVGGKSWSSGWLDMDNGSIHTPVHSAAIEAFNDPAWRGLATRFSRA